VIGLVGRSVQAALICAAYGHGVDEASLEDELLKAVRNAPGRRADDLAELVGLPRTNFGRPLGHLLHRPLEHLSARGLIEERRGRYRLAEPGRRLLAERAASPAEQR